MYFIALRRLLYSTSLALETRADLENMATRSTSDDGVEALDDDEDDEAEHCAV